MMTEEQLGKVVPADTVVMVKNVSRVDQACSLLRSRFEVRGRRQRRRKRSVWPAAALMRRPNA